MSVPACRGPTLLVARDDLRLPHLKFRLPTHLYRFIVTVEAISSPSFFYYYFLLPNARIGFKSDTPDRTPTTCDIDPPVTGPTPRGPSGATSENFTRRLVPPQLITSVTLVIGTFAYRQWLLWQSKHWTAVADFLDLVDFS